MKYEYLKGSERNFIGVSDAIMVAYKLPNCGVNYSAISSSEMPAPRSDYIIAERRPITEPVWDGEGLPPVGVECEGLFPRHPGNSFEWQDCLVLYVFEHECAVKSKGASTLHYCDQFRPIRSPEDVARDEGKEVIAESLRSSKDYDEAAGAIYDAIAAGRIKGLTKEASIPDLKININTDEMWREFEKKSDMDDVRKLVMERASRRGNF